MLNGSLTGGTLTGPAGTVIANTVNSLTNVNNTVTGGVLVQSGVTTLAGSENGTYVVSSGAELDVSGLTLSSTHSGTVNTITGSRSDAEPR